MSALLWSFVLSSLAIIGLIVAEYNPKLGCWIGVFDQFIWITYSIVTEQYWFIMSSLVYCWYFPWRYRRTKKNRESEWSSRTSGEVTAETSVTSLSQVE